MGDALDLELSEEGKALLNGPKVGESEEVKESKKEDKGEQLTKSLLSMLE